jgi:apolipoprotein N-acyltransferase
MNRHLLRQRISRGVIATTAGALFPFGFAPFGYVAVAPLAIGTLFLLWVSANAKQSALLGLYFGLGAFAVGVSWVFVSLHNYGNMPVLLAILVVAVFVSIMALYPAVCGFVQGSFGHLPCTIRLLFVMPALWVMLEWLRGQLLGGFPWLYLGYAQVDTPFASVAPFAGVLAVSLFAAIAGSAVILILIGTLKQRLQAVAALIVLFGIGLLAGQADFAVPDGEAVKIAVVQNNVSLADKWDAGKAEQIVSGYLKASANETSADLIVWPEAALPVYLDQLPTLFLRQLIEHPADYLFGVLERQEGEPRAYFNSAVGVTDDVVIYRKQQLVIFGEYLPLPFLFRWLLDYFEIPMSDFSSWPNQQLPLLLADQKVGVTICYEDAFQKRVGSALPAATMLANISEDSWFGDSLAPRQRLQMARTRALEVSRPFIRANNNGLSALIDHQGRVVALAPMFRPDVLRGELQPMQGATPFVLFGNIPLITLLGLLLVCCLFTPRALLARKRA